MVTLEPRLNAFRPDRADARLKGKVEAATFVDGDRRRVVANSAPMRHKPASDAPFSSEMLRGEVFVVFDETPEGWAWGQLETDAYVGYAPSAALGPIGSRPSHRVSAIRTFLYPGPDHHLPYRGHLSFG